MGSKELYDACQNVTQHRLHPKKQKHMFPLRGLVTCAECGCMCTPYTKKEKYEYYRCTNGKGICTSIPSMTNLELYKEISDLLNQTKFDPELVEIMYEAAKEKSYVKSNYNDQKVIDLEQQAKVLTGRKNTLLDAFLDKSIDKDTYEMKNRELPNELVQITEVITRSKIQTENSDNTLELVKNVFLDCIYWADNFLVLPREEKQKVAHTLLSNFSVKDKKVIDYKLKSIYTVLVNAPKKGDIDELLADKDSNFTY